MNLTSILKKGGLAVIPTDTLYGIHALALNPQVVEKLYRIRKRKPDKPFIILIGSINQLELFDVNCEKGVKEILEKYWPGKVSVVLPCPSSKFKYLHRGTNSLAFRFPANKDLVSLISQTGPLISTSVNPEGLPPAINISQAKSYFGNNIDFYLDKGPKKSFPSTIISIYKNKIKILRQGEVKISEI